MTTKQRFTRMSALTVVGVLAFLLACGLPIGKPTSTPTPAPSPTPAPTPTPSMLAWLVGKEGRVEVAQPVQASYQAARLGMPLQTGDGIKTYEQSVAEIFCEGGNAQRVGAEREEIIACQQGIDLSSQLFEPLERGHESRLSLALPARESPADYGNVPVILSPRNTRLMISNPTFRWTAVDGATKYAAIVQSPAGEVWRGETDQTELAYPSDAPALTDSTTYLLSVEAYLDAAAKPRESTEVIFFSILPSSQIKEIQALKEELEASSLAGSSQRFILGALYTDRELYHAAITTYENLVADDEQAVYRSALGDLYVQIKLYRPALEHYTRAVELAVAESDKTTQATAEAGLGTAYHGYDNVDEALKHLEKSRALYEELGDAEQIKRISDLIVRAQAE